MKIIIFFFSFAFAGTVYSQETDIGLFYGRFYPVYKFKDDGTGFRNWAKYQYKGYPALCINKRVSKNISAEATISYLAYQQYTATRLYSPGFYSEFYTGNISLTFNYSIINKKNFEARIKMGLGVGIIPDRYEGEFTETFVGTGIDSISRGFIKRDYSLLFPTLCAGIDFSYRLGNRFKLGLGMNYQKGFFKITEYDVYYNDGSGKNDQHARQWGNGSFYAFQAGIRYVLANNKK